MKDQQSQYESFISTHLHQLVDQSRIGVFLFHEDQISYVNPCLAEMFGYSREEIIGMQPKELVFEEDRAFFKDKISRRLRGEGRGARNWLRGLRKDGSLFYYEAKGLLVEYDGRPALVGTLTDVTSTIKADEILREHELRYQRLIKYLPEPIVVHDGETILYTNNAGLLLFGATRVEELFTVTYMDLIYADYRQMTSERMSLLLASDEPLDFMKSKIVSLDGRIIDVEVSGIRIHNFQGRPFVVQSVFRDLTERKREEEAIIRSEKLSVAGQMAAGIAHEIRNPLTSLKGFTQFLKTKVSDHHEYFNIMLAELDRINTIVQEFMALAKPQVKQFSQHNLASILENVITLLETQAIMNNVEMKKDFAAKMPTVYCDENQLKQVFINLMKNAIEAMPSGGDLSITLKEGDAGMLIVRIQDQGVGIPKDKLERLGSPFYSTKSSGTGLGLMICLRIIEAHRGTLKFESEESSGTTVTVELPAFEWETE
ncbi:PAS domain S-box protein [Paenibacillus sepulcri]|uniref:histidine kinase n=1 Tax=Paenibacillus sepulcri TaxID=359917 RepID=A0ABS7C414_9BACL|nr:PAS domain S-box protein [Paenibacillus sepulcri]